MEGLISDAIELFIETKDATHFNEEINVRAYEDLVNDLFTVCKKVKEVRVEHELIYVYAKCCNPSLGLTTKARGCKVMGQEGNPGITSHAPKSAKSVRE